jgi:hypothetical protein
MGVNRPSVESSELTTMRKIVPHTTSPKREKEGRVCDKGGADAREGKKKEEKNSGKYRVSDSREEGE